MAIFDNRFVSIRFSILHGQNHRKSEIDHIISNMESFGTSHFRYYMIFAPYKIEEVVTLFVWYDMICIMWLKPRSATGQAACNKCAKGEKQHNPIARVGSKLCVPFYNAENENFFFCRFANWKKTSPRQCAQRDQSDQNRSFWQIAHMGFQKICAYGYHNARIHIVRT